MSQRHRPPRAVGRLNFRMGFPDAGATPRSKLGVDVGVAGGKEGAPNLRTGATRVRRVRECVSVSDSPHTGGRVFLVCVGKRR